ncbi:prefoldin 5 [Brevipalpus obovatus]|uniref:prefoldin 5 n=1 Tax=Brevipalpus obovatus TaxID=246614 RepID=UPI003D9E6CD4
MSIKATPADMSAELSLQQLSALRNQLDQDIELLTTSISQLNQAQTKFQESGEVVSNQSHITSGTEILVPLTASMYINGSITNNDKFLIDIGTGYYIERNREGTVDYFKRKVAFLNQEIEKCVKITQQKIGLRESVNEALVLKQKATPAKESANASTSS